MNAPLLPHTIFGAIEAATVATRGVGSVASVAMNYIPEETRSDFAKLLEPYIGQFKFNWNSLAPDYFGALHADGANPAQTDLLAFAVAVRGRKEDPESEQERIATLRAAALHSLQKHHPDGLSDEDAAKKLNDLETQLRTAMPDTAQDIISAAESVLGVTLHPSADAEAEKLRDDEARRREAYLATLTPEEKAAADAAAAAPVEAAGILNEESKSKMLAGVDTIFNEGAKAGYPSISKEQRHLVKAVLIQEFHAAQSWENDYAVAWGVTTTYQYLGAAIGTGDAAIDAAAKAYEESRAKAGLDGTAEDWKATFKTDASAAWEALRETIDDEGARQFEMAHGAVSLRTLQEIGENAAFALGHTENHTSMRGSDDLKPETLKYLKENAPEIYNKLTDNGKKTPTYFDLTILIAPETKRYINTITLTDGGKGDQIAIPENLIDQTPMGALRKDGVITSASALEIIGSTPSWENPAAVEKTKGHTRG